ncbi:MAG: MaoC family dehydratase [Chloroflexota bacterium]|nr:MaoC family dehydratase [Chloroflexota bacterium]
MSAPDTLAGAARAITQEQLRAYADASGDHNPLHLDPGYAATTMFGRPIAHGMLVLAFVSEMMTDAFGERWLEGGSLRARFRAPVYPGDTVRAAATKRGEEDGAVHYDVAVRNQDDQAVIDGHASVKEEEA